MSYLQLSEVTKSVGADVHLYPMSLNLEPNAVTILLGATQAGKTSVMRLMAGLDMPSSGDILVDGHSVTGVPVRERNVAMVYQQFINYPSLTVFDNIASPLKLRHESQIEQQVHQLAKRLHIEAFLNRFPSELSGGQQQRVALARALAKNAPLVFLDEPLVNLDYKLREELRDELALLFATGQSTVVYATTEPAEALLLGGYTAVLKDGRLLQYGPTLEVFRRPNSLDVALAFSDPPLNVVSAHLQLDATWQLNHGPSVGLGDVYKRQAISGQVQLAEISGTDTFVHFHCALGEWVMQKTGVHFFELGSQFNFYFDPSEIYVFDPEGKLVAAPQSFTNGGA